MVAPKGIACSRVLPKTHTDIYITNTTRKQKTKLQTKTNYRQITAKKTKTNYNTKTHYNTKTNYRQFTKEIKHNKRLGIALVETFVH